MTWLAKNVDPYEMATSIRQKGETSQLLLGLQQIERHLTVHGEHRGVDVVEPDQAAVLQLAQVAAIARDTEHVRRHVGRLTLDHAVADRAQHEDVHRAQLLHGPPAIHSREHMFELWGPEDRPSNHTRPSKAMSDKRHYVN
jgi:hypothetical protein